MVPPVLSPHPLRAVVESSGGAEWWEVVGALGPLVALLAAVVTGVIGWRSLRHSQRVLEQEAQADRLELEQRALADQKAQWWERVQWALDAAFSGDLNRKAAGIAMVRVLSEPEWLTAEELLLLDAAWREGLEPEGTSQQSRGVRAEVGEEAERVRVEAARLRVALDRRLERATPGWVGELAGNKP
jgi:hypothetical protein